VIRVLVENSDIRATSLALCLLAACGADGGVDDPIPQGFQPFVSGEWSMPPGDEGYYCVRTTAEQDFYIRAFRPIAPLGTHHTALAIDLEGGEDGGFACGAQDVGFKLLFGSGVGTTPYALPEGVAFKLEAGTQVILNPHLYNTTDAPITGTSGVEIERIALEDMVHEAEVVYALHTDLTVPPGTSTTTGQCTFNAAATVFGVFPHMHQLGRNMKATLLRDGSEPRVFFDEAYAFEEQLNYETELVEVQKNDTISYDCSFENPGSQTIRFGDSSDAEMCVLGMYRYPSQGAISLCID
jgi:hypothetical protein